MIAGTVLWCIVTVTGSLESNAPKACYDVRSTCEYTIKAMQLKHAYCSRRNQENA